MKIKELQIRDNKLEVIEISKRIKFDKENSKWYIVFNGFNAIEIDKSMISDDYNQKNAMFKADPFIRYYDGRRMKIEEFIMERNESKNIMILFINNSSDYIIDAYDEKNRNVEGYNLVTEGETDILVVKIVETTSIKVKNKITEEEKIIVIDPNK